MRTAGEGGEPFSQSVFPSLPRYLLLLLPNQPGGNKRLKQYDARGGGKVDAADFAFDGDADMMRREPDHFGGNPEVSRPKTRESFSVNSKRCRAAPRRALVRTSRLPAPAFRM